MIGFLLLVGCFLFGGAAFGFAAFVRAGRVERRLRSLEHRRRDPVDDISASARARVAPGTLPWATQTLRDPVVPANEFDGQEADEPETAARDRDISSVDEDASAVPVAEPVRPPRQSLEERIGTRWAVWVGGLALVLGGVFLVRYSIDAGLLTPAARVLAGALLALALAGAGEWLRRKEVTGNTRETQRVPYIPGVLTLAGTTTAFATVFTAYALYGLIGPGPAFVLLAIVALATLAAAVLHGPAVASYGILASYGIPFLVHADRPAIWPLALYGIFVSLAAYAVARLRLWRWFAFAAAGGAVFWGHVLAVASTGPWDGGAMALYDLAVFAMAAFVFVVSLYPRDAAADSRQDWPAAIVLFCHAIPVLYLLQIDGFGTVSLAVLMVTAAAMLALAVEWPAASAAALGAATVMVVGYLSWDVPLSPVDFQNHFAQGDRIAAALANPSAKGFLRTGVLLGLLGGGFGLWGAWRSSGRRALAAAGAVTPLALLGIAYFRLAPFETSLYFGAAALALAVVFLCAVAFLDKHLSIDLTGREAALAAYSVGTVGAIAASMGILLKDGWLPVGLSLLAAGTIWVRRKWPLTSLSWVSLGIALLTCATIAYEPTIVGSARLGRTPVFNALLYGYGVPTLAFGYCAWQLGRTGRNRVQQIFEALTMLMALVTAAVLVHHAMNGGAFYADPDTLAEWSLHTLVLLAGALAVQRVHQIADSPVLACGSLLMGVFGFAEIAATHLIILNPYLTGESIGHGLLFNVLFAGYLLPAILCVAIALWRESWRPHWYRLTAGWLAGALIFAWISLEVRACFHRPHLDAGVTTAAELYSYSAAWLVFGLLLLMVGFWRGSRMIRLASVVFVLAAAAKVFVFDMAGLGGVWRALSFIGLGIVLIGIGLLYQRLLRSRPEGSPQPVGGTS